MNTHVLGTESTLFKRTKEHEWQHITKMFECMGKGVDQNELQINIVWQNINILWRLDNCLKLTFLESLAIKEHRPELNTGIKSSKEL